MTSTRKRRISFVPQRIDSRFTSTGHNHCTGISQSTSASENDWEPGANLVGTQVTVSENHPGWNRRRRSLSDYGGNFSTTKTYGRLEPSTAVLSGRAVINACSFTQYEYRGPIMLPGINSMAFPSATVSSNSTLNGWGAKAIARCRPTNSVMDLATSLAELARPGGIPTLISKAWKEGAERALHASADDLLSIEFGWRPLISDIVSFTDIVSRASTLLKQYERDAGKVVRRQWQFEPELSNTTTVINASAVPSIRNSNASLVQDSAARGKVVRIREDSTRRWFSGAFTYYLPAGYSSAVTMKRLALEADKLLGLQLTPETLWNLAPWSWAVDWFSSAGDVISNLSSYANDGLVMRYGYIMEHRVLRDIYVWTDSTAYYGVKPGSLTLTYEHKVRRKANPYGFGLTWDGLTSKQGAILGALGITRST